MRRLSLTLGFSVLLLAAPLAATRADAATVPAYHPGAEAGHGALHPAGWSGRDDDHDDDWDDDWDDDRDDEGEDGGHRRHHHWDRGPHWSPPLHGDGFPYFAPRPLAPWVVEHRLRRQHFQPIGRLVLQRGLYLVPALDPHGRRVVLVIDPITAVILGRQRHW